MFYGINTELFQCGCEVKSKIALSLPWKFAAKINVKEKKFEFDFPLFKDEFEVVSIRLFTFFKFFYIIVKIMISSL